jgi:hypothetical protein
MEKKIREDSRGFADDLFGFGLSELGSKLLHIHLTDNGNRAPSTEHSDFLEERRMPRFLFVSSTRNEPVRGLVL